MTFSIQLFPYAFMSFLLSFETHDNSSWTDFAALSNFLPCNFSFPQNVSDFPPPATKLELIRRVQQEKPSKSNFAQQHENDGQQRAKKEERKVIGLARQMRCNK